MMSIVAHRGVWRRDEEKNTFEAFHEAFLKGYGIEIDIRDYCERLVVSHNIATRDALLFENVLEDYQKNKSRGMIAINIKADGLQALIGELLKKYSICNYFLFDMSIPELVVNEREKLKYYTRCSDIENECVMLEKAAGVWLDSFFDKEWLDEDIIKMYVDKKKPVCIISPEIHGFDYKKIWMMLKKTGLSNSDLVALCTDRPDEARSFFYG